MTFKQTYDFAQDLSYGCQALGFTPTIMSDGKDWRFLGIQSKNRKEWALTHLANMFQRVTTVAFYDTLGPEATKYCVDQTQVTTIACTIDCVTKLAQLKKDEAGTGVDKMRTLDNIIVFGLDNE